MKRCFTCHTISPGTAEGKILISAEPLLFYKADPVTGVITEAGHCLEGKSIKDTILVFPGGKGSSVVQADGLYRLEKHGGAPRAFIVTALDTVLVSSAVIMEIPLVDRVEAGFYELARNGVPARVDARRDAAGRGTVELPDCPDQG